MEYHTHTHNQHNTNTHRDRPTLRCIPSDLRSSHPFRFPFSVFCQWASSLVDMSACTDTFRPNQSVCSKTALLPRRALSSGRLQMRFKLSFGAASSTRSSEGDTTIRTPRRIDGVVYMLVSLFGTLPCLPSFLSFPLFR
jgi:hypothetical protein